MAFNLRPHQYQIGDVVFGANTSYPVLGVAVQTYNVNNQDFQLARSNETRMGIDTDQAGPVTFTIGVIDNAPMSYIPNTLPSDLVAKSSQLLTALQREWKADDVKQAWGQLKPITFCNGYGSTRRIYGRPRKFQYSSKTPKSQFYKVSAEYARIDTYAYDDTETVAALTSTPTNYSRLYGDANAWFRLLLTGPQTNPEVTIGDELVIQLQTVIDAGVTVEVNGYPWSRRIIDSNGGNRRSTMVGNTKYLDQLLLPPATSLPMSWTATGTTGASKCLVAWRDAYNTLF